MCGSCATGFTGDGLKCTGLTIEAASCLYLTYSLIVYCIAIALFILSDLDECAQDGSLCDQICNNTFGSFVCTCEPGYVLVNDICEGKHNIFHVQSKSRMKKLIFRL